MPTNSRPIGNVSANEKPVSAASGTARVISPRPAAGPTARRGPAGSGSSGSGAEGPSGMSGTAGPGSGTAGWVGVSGTIGPVGSCGRGDLEHGAGHDEDPLLLSWREAASSTSTRRWWRPS